MVCGLLTDGSSLSKKKYLDQLLQTGLDHILFNLDPEQAEDWKAIKLIVEADIFLTVHLTINKKTARDGEKDPGEACQGGRPQPVTEHIR